MNKIEILQTIINESKNIVFFGGAGVSTESGIPDFRSVDGLYHMKYSYPPEIILSKEFFYNNTEEFYKFYFDKMIISEVKPNFAHYKLAEMEKSGKLLAVITQNIDGLHTLAGSKKVFELHGSINRNYCLNCGKFYSLSDIEKFKNSVPHCECGGIIKPDVVLYNESLNNNVVKGTINAISNADTLIIAGTSLTVYPASGLIHYFSGKNLVVINKTEVSANAKLFIKDKVGETLNKIKIK